jgi:hypothetical protein
MEFTGENCFAIWGKSREALEKQVMLDTLQMVLSYQSFARRNKHWGRGTRCLKVDPVNFWFVMQLKAAKSSDRLSQDGKCACPVVILLFGV